MQNLTKLFKLIPFGYLGPLGTLDIRVPYKHLEILGTFWIPWTLSYLCISWDTL